MAVFNLSHLPSKTGTRQILFYFFLHKIFHVYIQQSEHKLVSKYKSKHSLFLPKGGSSIAKEIFLTFMFLVVFFKVASIYVKGTVRNFFIQLRLKKKSVQVLSKGLTTWSLHMLHKTVLSRRSHTHTLTHFIISTHHLILTSSGPWTYPDDISCTCGDLTARCQSR